MSHPDRPPPPPRGGTLRKWLPAVIGGMVFLAIGAAAAIYFLVVRPGGGPQLASAVPRDIDGFVEVPDVPRALAGFAAIEYLDKGRFGMTAAIEQATDELARSFQIARPDAERTLAGVRSLAVASRDRKDDFQGAVLIRFAAAEDASALTASPIFAEPTALGGGGQRYKLRDAEQQGRSRTQRVGPRGRPRPGPVQRIFFGRRLELNELAWFAKRKLMVVGTPALIDDVAAVLAGEHDALAGSPAFDTAMRELPRDVAAFGYIDMTFARRRGSEEEQRLIDGVMRKPVPVVAALSFSEEGTRLTMHGGLSGKLLPAIKSYTAPVSLNLADRLPAETVGYFGLSTKSTMRGDEVEAMLLERSETAKPGSAKSARREIADAEKSLGFRLTAAYNALGDQGVVGALMSSGYQFDLTKWPKFPDELAIIYLQQLRDEAIAKRVIDGLRQNVFESTASSPAFSVSKHPDGFDAEPNRPTGPFVKLRIREGTLFAGIGRRDTVERAWSAFAASGKRLKTDEGHERAIARMPKDAHGRLWIDVARVLRESAVTNPKLDNEARAYGIALSDMKLSGAQRVSSALSFGWEPREEVWHYRFDTLNVTSLQVPAAYFYLRRAAQAQRLAVVRGRLRDLSNEVRRRYQRRRRKRMQRERDAWLEEMRTQRELEEPGGSDAGLEELQPRKAEVGDLCGNASAAPPQIPKAGALTRGDFTSGDEHSGWRCLGWSSEPDGYQYSYVVGGPYKGPARGGPDPGLTGFEASAEGDFDGNGRTSLFTISGSIDVRSGDLRVPSSVFSVDEHE